MSVDQEEYINLIARCALKDQTALKSLYEKTSPYLNKVAFRILQSEDMSNDAIQEAFVQIWNNASEFRPQIAKPLTWMTSITRYRALDRLAHEKRYRDPIDFDQELNSVDAEDQSASPEAYAIASKNDGFLDECLQTLNERARKSVSMAYLHGCSREEIADRFKSNVNTIKSWLRRGVERLKQCIDQKTQ